MVRTIRSTRWRVLATTHRYCSRRIPRPGDLFLELGEELPLIWQSLDFISVDAYFPLKAPATASIGDLVSAWQQWVARLTRMSRSFGKPLVLSESGATSLAGSFQQPWLWDNGQAVDVSAQQLYYDAACQAIVHRFGGVYWWMYTLDPPAKPALDRGFMIAGKPADASLAHCFGGSAILPTPSS